MRHPTKCQVSTWMTNMSRGPQPGPPYPAPSAHCEHVGFSFVFVDSYPIGFRVLSLDLLHIRFVRGYIRGNVTSAQTTLQPSSIRRTHSTFIAFMLHLNPFSSLFISASTSSHSLLMTVCPDHGAGACTQPSTDAGAGSMVETNNSTQSLNH